MISQVIDPSRTILFARKYAFENARIYLLLYFAIAAFLILWLGVYLVFSNSNLFSERAQVAYFFVTLFLSGCLSSGMLFSELGSRPKAINYLLLPASLFEKFMTNLFYGVFVFLIACCCIFSLVNFGAVSIANYKYGTHWEVINLVTINKYPNPFWDGPSSDIFYLYFPIQALFLLCSIYFKKHGLFKAFVTMGLLWVLGIGLFLLLQFLMPRGRFVDSMDSYEIIEASGDNKLIAIPSILVMVTAIFFKLIVTPLLWATAFFRLKEKELN